MIFSIQTLKSISNFSNVKRKISEIWRDGRRKAGRNGKRETVGDRKEGEGDWGEGTKSPGETKKEILIKLEKEARKRQKRKTENAEKSETGRNE